MSPRLRPTWWPLRKRPGWVESVLTRRWMWVLAAIVIAVLVFRVVGYDRFRQLRPTDRDLGDTVAIGHRPQPPVQTVLPFTGLSGPQGVAVDAAGNVYVADSGNDRVLKLAPESGTQQTVGLTEFHRPFGVAVGSGGTVYVVDQGDRVLEWVGRSGPPRVTSFPHGEAPTGVAVDTVGALYLSQCLSHRVIKLDAESRTQRVLGFTGLGCPGSIAVDAAGAVYVVDQLTDRLEVWTAANTRQTIRLPDLFLPGAIATGPTGNVFAAQGFEHRGSQVVELATRSAQPRQLPFSGLKGPAGVAADSAGNVYVSDYGNNRIVKLSAG